MKRDLTETQEEIVLPEVPEVPFFSHDRIPSQSAVFEGFLIDATLGTDTINEPSIELLRWMLLNLWPSIKEVAQQIVKEKVEPHFDKALDKLGVVGQPFKGIHFSHFDLGDVPPTIGPVKAYRRASHEHFGIEIDCSLDFDMTPNINLVIMGYDIGISRLIFNGVATVILKPLLNKKPIVGGAQVFLLNPPTLDFSLSGTIQGINGSIVHHMMKDVILEQINKKLVLPNRVSISLVKEWDIVEDIVSLQNPRPEKIIRIRVKSASSLPVGDVQWANMFGMGTETSKKGGSDPYVVVQIGAQTMKTPTVTNDINPEYEKKTATFDFFLYNIHQVVEFDVFDDDFGMSEDDYLLGTKMLVKDLLACSSHNLPLHDRESLDRVQQSGDVDEQEPMRTPLIRQETMIKRTDTSSDPSSLAIDVSSFSLVPCTPAVLKELQSLGVGPNEGIVGVNIYGLGPIGSRKTLDDASHILVQITIRRQKDSQHFITKKPHIRMQYPSAHGVDKHSMKVVQNMKFMNPDLPVNRIGDIVGITNDVVDKILQMKRLLPIVYNQASYLFVESSQSDIVVIELLGPHPGEPKKTAKHVISSMELRVQDIADAEDCTIMKSFIFKEIAHEESTARPQEYELLLKLQVWAFKLDINRNRVDSLGTLVC